MLALAGDGTATGDATPISFLICSSIAGLARAAASPATSSGEGVVGDSG